jgi:hypothetical protein
LRHAAARHVYVNPPRPPLLAAATCLRCT